MSMPNDHTFDALLHGVQAVNKLDTANGGLFPKVMSYAWPWIAQSVDKAVLPILYAATSPHVIGRDPMHVLAFFMVVVLFFKRCLMLTAAIRRVTKSLAL